MFLPLILFFQALFWVGKAGRVPGLSKKDNYGIIGGYDIDITVAPYHVSIQYSGMPFCNGALIAPDIVVATAECLMMTNNITRMKVRAGSAYTDTGGEYVGLRKILLHPDVYRSLHDYNLGLAWLSKPLTLSDQIGIIEMKEQDEEVEEFQNVHVTGWGITADWDIPVMLQKIETKVLSNVTCAQKMKFSVRMTPRLMCIAPSVENRGIGACLTWSAPLVHKGKLAGLFFLTQTWLCGVLNKHPEVFTKVSSMRNWIDEAIKNETMKFTF